MERPAKAQRLNAFRRQLPAISASALSAALKAVQAQGLPEGALSRAAFRKARDAENLEKTPRGPILSSIDLVDKSGQQRSIPIANPFAMLWTIVKRCDPFSEFLRKRLHQCPPITRVSLAHHHLQ